MCSMVQFFNENVDFSLEKEKEIRKWIVSVIESHNHKVSNINYVFCDDEFLLEINKTHLNHDYYTDIITFNLSEEEKKIEADIFISIDRVKENSNNNASTFTNELHRVIIHGILHLIGFNDKTKEEEQTMRKKEDSCLYLLNN